MRKTKPSPKELRARLATLTQENRRLKRENRRLLEALGETSDPADASERPSPILDRLRTARLYTKRTYLLYLFALLRASRIYGIGKRAVSYFRRYRMTILFLQILLFALTLPKNGAIFLAVSALSAVTLPTLAVLVTVLLQSASLRKKRELAHLRARINTADRIYVFPLPRSRGGTPALLPLLERIASEDRATVLAVSPYLVSPRGIGHPRRHYVAAREEAPGVFLLRTHAYYALRKHPLPETVTFY